MFKKVIISLIASSLLATPAMAQRWQGFDESATAGSQAQRRDARTTDAPAAPGSYREGYTREQLTFAMAAQREAVRMCRSGNLNAGINRMLTDVGTEAVGEVIAQVVNGRGSHFYRGSYRSYGRDDSSQDCNALGQQVYQDALRAQPDSYCDSSMIATYTRGGQPVTEERMTRRCQSRRADASWDTPFQPRNR